ncbi:5-demethoxyubiquinol-8 5-hydroxylase UbiM [Sphingomonas sp. HF-S4]|uniref:5-demethoxyubiquinol-8 5-hydroxylase UbiM n=1 Tax=Sphingomonas agrestis TaxID=3080540 RepID=A0ABU3Y3M8_9SPHN|nr:5-demethoxyubiquinol-8 5-hydroxylase UbiM [Sphingomonas sp. HF-S4]MDV3455924.1 5-demethoxyubiquinol-8 5-hydroxylase UbiM [Sphingomonas sp. HF-S4]
MDCDVIIVGAGPAGLALARSLADTGLDIVVVERQPLAAIADPCFDGREIALTHGSADILTRLGAWDLIPEDEISPLRAARVLNGGSPFALDFDASGEEPLGWLVPNHRIRAALFDAIDGQDGLRLVTGAEVVRVQTSRAMAEVELGDGSQLRARLLVGADSRLSGIRGLLGISAEVNRLGRSMMVCRVRHPIPHHGIATEWFDHHQTMAMLPLGEGMSSAVLTLPSADIERLAALGDAELGAELTMRYSERLGPMEVAGPRVAYPLVTTWSWHFAATRAALIGDAAVGMHPVTAHGFNLGLRGADLLARLVRAAARRGRDPGATPLLRAYERRHRGASWPLYAGTNLLVRLYTEETMPARAMRHAGLRLGAKLPFVRPGIRRVLMAR